MCAQLHDASGRHRAGQVWRRAGVEAWWVEREGEVLYQITLATLPHHLTLSHCLLLVLRSRKHLPSLPHGTKHIEVSTFIFFQGCLSVICWHRFLTGFINVLGDELDIFLLLRQPACFCYHLSAAMVTKCPRDATKCHIGASTHQVILCHQSLLYIRPPKTHFQVS